MAPLKSNLKHLRTFVAHAPAANREKIKNVIALYEQRRIASYPTAMKNVLQLSHPSAFKKGQADRDYQNTVAKYHAAAPVVGRLRRQIEDRHSPEKEYAMTVLLYTSERKKDPTVDVKEDFVDEAQRAKVRKYLNKKHKGLAQFWKDRKSVV